MAYVSPNFPSKAALKRAVTAGERVTVFQPGPFPLDTSRGRVDVEGPHAPKPHRWWGTVETTRDGVVTRVLS